MSQENIAPEPEEIQETQESDEVEAHGVLGLQKLDTGTPHTNGVSDPAMSCSSCVAATVCTS
jgi:hypothetical protein